MPSNKTLRDCYNSPADLAIHIRSNPDPKSLEENVKSTCTLLLVLLLLLSISAAQNAPAAPAAPAARTDVYHVHFAAAAPGKAAQMGDALKTQNPKAPMPGHYLVLRHQDGVDWDFAVIEHLGTKATVEATPGPTPPAVRDLYAWHTDTFVNGPAWPEFAKAMGIGDQSAGKSADSVYVVSVYRAAPGHRDRSGQIDHGFPGSLPDCSVWQSCSRYRFP